MARFWLTQTLNLYRVLTCQAEHQRVTSPHASASSPHSLHCLLQLSTAFESPLPWIDNNFVPVSSLFGQTHLDRDNWPQLRLIHKGPATAMSAL